MEEILKKAIRRTPDNKESGKATLENALSSLQRNQRVAKYGGWVQALTGVVEKPSVETLSKFFEETGEENLPVALREIGINYATTHPISGMEEILKKAIRRTPDNKESGKAALKYALNSLQRNQRVVDRILSSTPTPKEVKEFDPATRKLIYQRLKRLPSFEIRKYKIDPDSIQQYRPILKPFPGSKKKIKLNEGDN